MLPVAHGPAAIARHRSAAKSRREVEALLSRWFEIMPGGEADWMRYRVAHHPSLRRFAPVSDLTVWDPLLRFVGNGLAGHVYRLRKPNGAAHAGCGQAAAVTRRGPPPPP